MKKLFVKLRQEDEIYQVGSAIIRDLDGVILGSFEDKAYIVEMPEDKIPELQNYRVEGRKAVSKVYEGRIPESTVRGWGNWKPAVDLWHDELKSSVRPKMTPEVSEKLKQSYLNRKDIDDNVRCGLLTKEEKKEFEEF